MNSTLLVKYTHVIPLQACCQLSVYCIYILYFFIWFHIYNYHADWKVNYWTFQNRSKTVSSFVGATKTYLESRWNKTCLERSEQQKSVRGVLLGRIIPGLWLMDTWLFLPMVFSGCGPLRIGLFKDNTPSKWPTYGRGMILQAMGGSSSLVAPLAPVQASWCLSSKGRQDTSPGIFVTSYPPKGSKRYISWYTPDS